MATAIRCDPGSDGIQRGLLEASLEHSGRTVHGSLGECAAHQECAGSQDRPEGCGMHCAVATVWPWRANYVTCEIIRDLRDLTRMRASLSQEASRLSSRIQKVLEDANVKLASVATNV